MKGVYNSEKVFSNPKDEKLQAQLYAFWDTIFEIKRTGYVFLKDVF